MVALNQRTFSSRMPHALLPHDFGTEMIGFMLYYLRDCKYSALKAVKIINIATVSTLSLTVAGFDRYGNQRPCSASEQAQVHQLL